MMSHAIEGAPVTRFRLKPIWAVYLSLFLLWLGLSPSFLVKGMGADNAFWALMSLLTLFAVFVLPFVLYFGFRLELVGQQLRYRLFGCIPLGRSFPIDAQVSVKEQNPLMAKKSFLPGNLILESGSRFMTIMTNRYELDSTTLPGYELAGVGQLIAAHGKIALISIPEEVSQRELQAFMQERYSWRSPGIKVLVVAMLALLLGLYFQTSADGMMLAFPGYGLFLTVVGVTVLLTSLMLLEKPLLSGRHLLFVTLYLVCALHAGFFGLHFYTLRQATPKMVDFSLIRKSEDYCLWQPGAPDMPVLERFQSTERAIGEHIVIPVYEGPGGLLLYPRSRDREFFISRETP